MKILFVGHCIDRTFSVFLERLEEAGHRIGVIYDKDCIGTGYHFEEFVQARPMISLDYAAVERKPGQLMRALKFMKKFLPDLILADSAYPQGFVGLLGKLAGKPLIVWPLGADVQHVPEIGYGYKGKLRKGSLAGLAFRHADGIIVNSTDTLQELKKNWRLKEGCKIWLCPYGYDVVVHKEAKPQKLRKKLGLVGGFVVGTLSRINRQKGIEFLIRGMKAVVAKNKKAKLLVAGVGYKTDYAYLRELEKEVAGLQLNENVIFLDSAFGEKETEFLKTLDVFVISSLAEVASRTLLESLAHGIATIATKTGHAVDIIENGKNGFLVEKRSPEQIAEKIVLLMKKPALRKKLAANGKKAYENHKWKNAFGKWMEAFEEAGELFSEKHTST